MTGPKSQASPVASPGRRWHCLAEIALPTPLANVELALSNITHACQGFGVLTTDQERLMRALGEAVLRASARNGPQRTVSAVLVRLLMLQRPATLIAAEPASTHPTDQLSTSARSALTNSPALSGWSFFLVERNVSETREARKEGHYVIELFLYPASEEISHEQPKAV
jgi:hypothetical protein